MRRRSCTQRWSNWHSLLLGAILGWMLRMAEASSNGNGIFKEFTIPDLDDIAPSTAETAKTSDEPTIPKAIPSNDEAIQNTPPPPPRQTPPKPLLPQKEERSVFSFRGREGRVSLDLDGSLVVDEDTPTRETNRTAVVPHRRRASTPTPVSPRNTQSPSDPSSMRKTQQLSLQLDPVSATRLAAVLMSFSQDVFVAFSGTLRVLAPLIVARRFLNIISRAGGDYYSGRYIRKTYHQLEYKVVKYYQVPAALRAIARGSAQMAILMILGRIAELMVGLGTFPCQISYAGPCHWWCNLIWLACVVGTGNAAAVAIAVWGGPLKVQIYQGQQTFQERYGYRPARVFTRPWHILQWMRDPEEWIRMLTTRNINGTSDRFNPDPILFPTTWSVLRVLESLAVAKAMASSSNKWASGEESMKGVMRCFCIQQALCDEWHRVLLGERRIALGACAHFFYFWATVFLHLTIATIDGLSAVMFVPVMLATTLSGLMNLYLFRERSRERRRQRQAENNRTNKQLF